MIELRVLCVITFSTSFVAAMTLNGNTTTKPTSEENPPREVVHCYCNLPACVTTNYMCKSKNKGCFSDLVSDLDVDKGLHGCLDLLPSERGDECQNVPGPTPSSSQDLERRGSLLLCCNQDMCNYVNSPDTRINYNHTILAAATPILGSRSNEGRVKMGSAAYSSQEVWFKAATIAVPICGAMILLMLVLLAMKILRSDVLEDHRIMSAKLRSKDIHGNGGVGGIAQVVGGRCMNISYSDEKKHPLMFQYNATCPSCPRVHPILSDKNARNAKNNCNTEIGHDLLHKNLDLGSCNIYHNTTVPLLPPSSKEKLVYKKAFVYWPSPQV